MKRSLPAAAALFVGLTGCRKAQPSPRVEMVPAHAETAQAPAPAAAAAPSAGATVTVAGVAFDAPSGWTSQTPSSAMRAAQFAIPGSAGQENGELAVYYFGRDQGGGVAENVSRWEGQFKGVSGGPARGRSEQVIEHGLHVTTVTVEGTYSAGMPMGPSTPESNYALWGAIVEGPAGNVFLKAVGPHGTIADARPAFDRLLASIRPAETAM